MNRCMPIALLLGLSLGPAARAETRYQVGHTLYGCVDPRATLALTGRDGRLHPDGWAAYVRQSGRCFRLTPALRLEIITRNAGLVLVRRVPPRIGDPPVYVLASQIRTARQEEPSRARAVAGPAIAAQTERQSAVPPVTDAGPKAPAAEPIPAKPDMAGPSAGAPAAPGLPAGPALVPVVPPAAAPVPSGPDQARPAAPAVTAPVAAAPIVPPDAAPVAPAPVAPAMPNPAGSAAPSGAASGSGAMAPAIAPPAAPAPWPPRPAASGGWLGIGGLIAGLVTLLLLAFVAVALLVARRRRHFAHVEEDWPSQAGRTTSAPAVKPDPRLFPTAQAFRRHCASELERAGWVTQLAFPGDGSGPDILCRRAGTVLAVRCRLSPNDITSEMVDEAAVMGTKQAASVTMLASNAPFSQRARDEAIRHRIHLLRDNELSVFVG